MSSTVFLICVILNMAPFGNCFMYFETLADFTINASLSAEEAKFTHSEYKFGDCNRDDIKFYTHIHLDSLEFLGKLFVRGWLDIKRIPTCIILRAKSFDYHQLVATAYNFQICVPRIVYCHSHMRYRYYYYEWHIPYNYAGGMEWDLYFYGSPWLTW